MKLSILIASLVSRLEIRKELFAELRKQIGKHYEETVHDRYYTIEKYIGKEVEIIVCTDNKEMILGEKRNMLLRLADGEYTSFVDCDDLVSLNYVSSLLEGIATGKDVVCFNAMYYENGKAGKPVVYNGNYKKDHNDAFNYCRRPNHLMCIKKEIALQARFPEKNFGEDSEFATRLQPLLKTQALLNETLYHYRFNSKTSETQGK